MNTLTPVASNKAKVLFYDLEITPILAWTYEMWDTRVIKVERDPYIMCFSYKWLGEDEVHNVAQPDFPYYELEPYDDLMVVRELWRLLDEADIVVAHNARKFDNKIATARFLAQDMVPPSPYKTVDTLQAARRYFRFGSNSLKDLCERFEIGTKTFVTHGKIWHDCLSGDPAKWKLMADYCNQDVVMLEGLYYKLLPYISNHPNVVTLAGEMDGCPKCGSHRLHSRGTVKTATMSYKRWQCQECGGWCRERKNDGGDKPSFVNAI